MTTLLSLCMNEVTPNSKVPIDHDYIFDDNTWVFDCFNFMNVETNNYFSTNMQDL